jgi:hypothetical protein
LGKPGGKPEGGTEEGSISTFPLFPQSICIFPIFTVVIWVRVRVRDGVRFRFNVRVRVMVRV